MRYHSHRPSGGKKRIIHDPEQFVNNLIRAIKGPPVPDLYRDKPDEIGQRIRIHSVVDSLPEPGLHDLVAPALKEALTLVFEPERARHTESEVPNIDMDAAAVSCEKPFVRIECEDIDQLTESLNLVYRVASFETEEISPQLQSALYDVYNLLEQLRGMHNEIPGNDD